MRVMVQAGTVVLTMLLGGCGHSEVKAPCSASEGYMSLGSAADRCGPMRPVNMPDGISDQARRAGRGP